MRPSARTRGVLAAVTALGVASVAACGSDDTTDDAEPAAAEASDEAGDAAASGDAAGVLSGVCPDTITVQTDWNPEAEHGALYQMVGPDPVIDADAKTVTGPLVVGGEDTGVDIQVRAGGPAIGFQPVASQLYQDPDITLAYVSTDEAIAAYAEQPTIAVVAPLDINPQMIMWDPETYPDATEIADIGETDAKVLYFQGAVYMEYLTGTGVLQPDQVDGSYDGAPASFVASGGTIAQQGFATAEPYIYENEVAEWGKPVTFQLIHDTGYPIYSQPLAIRADDLETLSPCLELLVPIVQQSVIDYVGDPATANALILELVEQYDTGWVYSEGVADFSVEQQVELGIVGNGSDSTLGNFDEERVQEVLEIAVPILTEGGADIPDDLAPADLVTNEFIDESIGLE
jgi:hypothetical protein